MLFTLLLSIAACFSPSQDTKVDQNQNAPLSQLSKADQLILATAKGKTTENITFSDLQQKINQSKDKLHAFSFWKLANADARQMNRHLMKVQRELGEEKLKINYIGLDQLDQQMAINTYLREYGFTDDAYLLVDSLPKNWNSQIDHNWSGDLPAVLLVNQADGTFLFYQQMMTFEELLTLCQPLTI